jgi:hypothetical protein
MQHPFLDPTKLKEKSLEDLQKTISELTTKLTFAYRIQNGAMINQLNMILETYKGVYYSKQDEMFKKQNMTNRINVDKK